jgi:uncharacterized protein YdbL (DUF1318 family)
MFLGIVALLAVLPAPHARAGDREGELQERFKKRLPDIREAKAAGKIGETRPGLLEPVDEKKLDDKLRKLMDEENTDRKELYKLIATKEKTTEDKVAERAAARNYERARSGEYLKDKDGAWKQKK